MENSYYYLQSGQTLGPVGSDVIVSGIKSGTLGALDLIYRDGDPKWSPVHEFVEFKELLKTLKGKSRKKEDRWVLLVKKTGPYGVQYVQRGPYETEAIKTLLQSGQLSFTDFIWKEGDEKWQRVNAVEIFSPKPEKWRSPTLLPHDFDFLSFDEEVTQSKEIPTEEVTIVSRAAIPADEPPPAEAGTGNLAAKKPAAVGETPVTGEKAASPRAKPKTSNAPLELKKPAVASTYLPWIVGLAVLVVGTLIGVGRSEFNKLFPSKTKTAETVTSGKREAAPVAAAPSPSAGTSAAKPAEMPGSASPSEKAQTESAQSAEAPPEPKVEPRSLRMQFKNLTAPAAAIAFETDGSSHFPIELTIEGKAGDILDKIQIYRTHTLNHKTGESAEFSFDKHGLPKGRYRIQARIGNVSEEETFFLGIQDRQFRREMDKHRKIISLPFQRERRRLVSALTDFERIVQDLQVGASANAKSWGKFHAKWKASLDAYGKKYLRGVSPSKAQNFVFPVMWLELNERQRRLRSAADSINDALRAKRSVPRSEISAILKEVKVQKEAAIKLSLYR